MTPTLGFIGWLVIGGLAGWVASMIQKTDAQMGVGLNIVVGIIGGLLPTRLKIVRDAPGTKRVAPQSVRYWRSR